MFFNISKQFLISSLLKSLALVLTLGVVHAAYGSPCPTETQFVDLGLHDLIFAPSEDDTFRATGMGATVDVGSQGFEVMVNGYDDSVDAVDFGLHFVDGDLQLEPTGVEGTSVQRLELGSSVARQAMAQDMAWSSLEVSELYPGVRLTVSGSQRRLWLALDATSAQALAAVRLGFSGADLGVRDARTLTLSSDTLSSDTLSSESLPSDTPESASNPRRTLELEMVALEVTADGQRRLRASFGIERDQISLQLDEPVQGPVRVLLTSLLAPYTEPSDVIRLDNGRWLTVSSGRAHAGSDQRMVVIHELDAEATRILNVTEIRSQDDLEIRGVAEDQNEDLVLVGRRAVGDSSVPVAAVLDTRLGRLTELTAVAELGDRVHDVTLDANGKVFVVGRAGETFETAAEALEQVSVALPVIEEAVDRHFVAELDVEHDRVISAMDFSAPQSLPSLRAWIDCYGRLQIGIPWAPASANSVTHTYDISVSSADLGACVAPLHTFGVLGICWKAAMNSPDWTLHLANVNPSDFPDTLVFLLDPTDPLATGVADFEILNQLEANQMGNLFYDTTTHQWADPGGAWNHPYNWAYSKVELALAAAIYQTRWSSPIFANLRVPTDIDPPAVRAVMLREETFSADSSAELPHNLCNDDLDNNGVSDFGQTAWPTPFEHQVASACATAHGSSLTLDSIQYDTFRDGAAYIPDQTLLGSNSSWWPWFSPYVGDPPVLEDDEPGMSDAHAREMSRRLARWVDLSIPVEVTVYEQGEERGVERHSGAVSARFDI